MAEADLLIHHPHACMHASMHVPQGGHKKGKGAWSFGRDDLEAELAQVGLRVKQVSSLTALPEEGGLREGSATYGTGSCGPTRLYFGLTHAPPCSGADYGRRQLLLPGAGRSA